MRILFTTFPARGHFHPIAPLALAAQRLRHEVRVASGPDLAEWARLCGFDAEAVGDTQADLLRAAETSAPGNPASRLFSDVWVRSAFPDLMDLARTWKPDLVVHEEEEYTAPLVACLLGLRCITHSWHSPARHPDDRNRAAELLKPIWSEIAPGHRVRQTGALYLDACPPALQAVHVGDLGDVWQVRPVMFDGPSVAPPTWLLAPSRPMAYVTMGTVPVFSTAEGLRQAVLDLSPLFASIVVTTGPNRVESLGTLAPHVRAIPYLPQSLVLPHADIVVSQAGAGGTLGAIQHALPHLMLPSFAQSQVSLSRRVAALGAGIVLPAENRNTDNMRAAATALLSDVRFRRAATKLREEIDMLPGPEAVVQRLASSIEQIRP